MTFCPGTPKAKVATHSIIFNLLPICMKCCFCFQDYIFQMWENLLALLSSIVGLGKMVDKVLKNLQNNNLYILGVVGIGGIGLW